MIMVPGIGTHPNTSGKHQDSRASMYWVGGQLLPKLGRRTAYRKPRKYKIGLYFQGI